MTKEQVKQVIGNGNLYDMDGETVQSVIEHFSQFPRDALIELDHGYEGVDGIDIYCMREETDEEYAARLAKEAQSQREREARIRLAQETQAAKMERYAFEEVALHAYLKQHEGNPQINDLENLFRALQGLEREGCAGTSVQTLKECMAEIEKNS